MRLNLTGVVLDGLGAVAQTVQDLDLVEGEYTEIVVDVVHSDDTPWTDSGFQVVQTVTVDPIDGPLYARFTTLVAGTATLKVVSGDTVGYSGTYYHDVFLVEIATGKEYRIVKTSRERVLPVLYKRSNPVTPPGPAQGFIGVPPLPSPDYNKIPFYKSDGTVVWMQKQSATVTFTAGGASQVAASWPTFGSRPFAIRVASIETDQVEVPTISVLLTGRGPTGCTLQASAPFDGIVELELEEKIS